MDLPSWLAAHDRIAHRRLLHEAGFDARGVRRWLGSAVVPIGRNWVALADVDDVRRAAAELNARVACVSAARLRGWWVPVTAAANTHVHVPPSAATTSRHVHVHRTRPLMPMRPGELLESIEDTLQHVVRCCDEATALAIWESASRTERLAPAALQRIPWPRHDARRLAAQVTGLSDSGLETLLLRGVRHLGRELRPQALIAGHRVDLLIDDWLVVQVDGHAFHSSAADRGRDVAHDAELTLRGYQVLRFTYAQVVHDWATVERTIRRALLAGPTRR